MENQELFDGYIAEILSKEECEAFEQQLSVDKDLAQQFNLYLTTIYNIRKEEEQNCLEFGYAMQSLTKEHLKSIVGRKSGRRSEKKTILRRIVLWQTTSAAIIIIAIAVGVGLERNYRYAADDLLYSYNEPMLSNRGSISLDFDFTTSTPDELRSILPQLQQLYQESSMMQDVLMNGKSLAMVHIKLHQRRAAREILTTLINKCAIDDIYTDTKVELQRILDQIQ